MPPPQQLPATLLALFAALALTPAAPAGQRTHAPAPALADTSSAQAEATRVLRYWTPARMASARPLDLVLDRGGRADLRLGRPAPTAANWS